MEITKNPIGEIKNFFSGNPFSTPIGQKIEQATDPSLASENWALNIEICDMVNLSDDGAKDAIRAIKKRLQQNSGKNYTVIMFTLTVLETCVKNCGKRFHILVCQKDFIQDMVKLIGTKLDPPAVVQEKILGLIQSWADTFIGQPELKGVVEVYDELKSKGMEFPATDFEAMAPILTPKRSVEEPILHQVDFGERQVKLTPEQLVKIRKDLDVVQGNMTVFAEILGELKPGDGNVSDLELLDELYTTCKEMQKRIAELVCTISSDELTEEMLHMNDELNNLFLRYERLKRNVEKLPQNELLEGQQQQQQQRKQTQPTSGGAFGGKVEAEPSLIDFGSEPTPLNSRMGNMKLNESAGAASTATTAGDDFDMFAQSRKSNTSGSTYADNRNLDQNRSLTGALRDPRGDTETHRQSDFDEMEEWLSNNPPETERGAEGSMTSSEFDRFLSDRATAASSSRNIDKEKTENKMFAL